MPGKRKKERESQDRTETAEAEKRLALYEDDLLPRIVRAAMGFEKLVFETTVGAATIAFKQPVALIGGLEGGVDAWRIAGYALLGAIA